jgi:hypothetical protein
LEFPTKFIVFPQERQIIFQPQSLHDPRIDPQRDSGVSLLYLAQSAPRDACALRHSLR